MLDAIAFAVGGVSLLVTVLSFPPIHERFIDPLRFRRSDGRTIAGDYISVFYTNTKTPPQSWEKGTITQMGRRVHYQCKDNDSGFDYEMNGRIDGDIVTGHWVSHLPGEKVHGGATLHYTKRGHIVGIWVGDSKMNNFTWGYWALSKNRAVLEIFVRNMQEVVHFRGVDLVKLFEESSDEQT